MTLLLIQLASAQGQNHSIDVEALCKKTQKLDYSLILPFDKGHHISKRMYGISYLGFLDEPVDIKYSYFYNYTLNEQQVFQEKNSPDISKMEDIDSNCYNAVLLWHEISIVGYTSPESFEEILHTEFRQLKTNETRKRSDVIAFVRKNNEQIIDHVAIYINNKIIWQKMNRINNTPRAFYYAKDLYLSLIHI